MIYVTEYSWKPLILSAVAKGMDKLKGTRRILSNDPYTGFSKLLAIMQLQTYYCKYGSGHYRRIDNLVSLSVVYIRTLLTSFLNHGWQLIFGVVKHLLECPYKYPRLLNYDINVIVLCID